MTMRGLKSCLHSCSRRQMRRLRQQPRQQQLAPSQRLKAPHKYQQQPVRYQQQVSQQQRQGELPPHRQLAQYFQQSWPHHRP